MQKNISLGLLIFLVLLALVPILAQLIATMTDESDLALKIIRQATENQFLFPCLLVAACVLVPMTQKYFSIALVLPVFYMAIIPYTIPFDSDPHGLAEIDGRIKKLETAVKIHNARTYKLTTPKLIKVVNIDPNTPQERWINTDITTNEGFCYITKVHGRFDGTPEQIQVSVSGGKWVYYFDRGRARIWSRIFCLAYPKLIIE